MAPKIDELITAAQKSVDESTEESKAVAEARLAAFQEAKEAGITLSQDEVNNIIKTEKEKAEGAANDAWKEVLEMDLDEAKEILEGMNDEELQTLLGNSDSEEEGDEEESMPERVKTALRELKQEKDQLAESTHDFQRRYYDSDIASRLTNALRAEGLQDAYLDPAKRLSEYSKLVDKAMEGEVPSDDEIQQAAGSIKELSPVWFEDGSGEGSEDGSRVVAGVRVKDGIPATPRENRSAELTEAQRAERTASVY